MNGIRRNPRRQGISLQLTLAMVGILSILAMAMTALFCMNLNTSQMFANSSSAEQEAEAGVSQLMADLASDPTFGAARTEVIPNGFTAASAAHADAYHVVTFDSALANDLGVPWSVNNSDSTQASGCLGRSVPAKHIHAFSTGYARGQYATIEVLLEQPPYPYAIAVSGNLGSRGAIFVEGTSSADGYAAKGSDRPGHIAANSTRGFTVPSGTFISGQARSGGRLVLESPVTLLGGMREGCAPLTLPVINPTDYDPEGLAECKGLALTPPKTGTTPMNSFYKASSSVTFADRMTFENGFLFVDGDVTFSNGLQGVGAVVATGRITLTGAPSSMTGTDDLALVADGLITIDGGAAAASGTGSYFVGLVYSKTGVSAKNITVVGNVVVNADPRGAVATGKGDCALDNVKVVGAPVKPFPIARAGAGESGQTPNFVIRPTNPSDPNSPTTVSIGGSAGQAGTVGDATLGSSQDNPAADNVNGQISSDGFPGTLSDPSTTISVAGTTGGDIAGNPQAAQVLDALANLAKEVGGGGEQTMLELKRCLLSGQPVSGDLAKAVQETLKDIIKGRPPSPEQPPGTFPAWANFSLNNFLPTSETLRIQCWKTWPTRMAPR